MQLHVMFNFTVLWPHVPQSITTSIYRMVSKRSFVSNMLLLADEQVCACGDF